jgi:hypothetical protein
MSAEHSPVSWQEIFSRNAEEIDGRITSALGRGAGLDEAYGDVRNFAQGTVDPGIVPDCGPNADFDSECRRLFDEHVQRLELAGTLKRNGASYEVAQKSDMRGANQGTNAAGGAGPRGEGLSGEATNPGQWGRAGTGPQPEISGGRKGEETDVETSYDYHRKTDQF